MRKNDDRYTPAKAFCCYAIVLAVLLLVLAEGFIARAVSPKWTGSIATGFAGGTGTEADPYLISTGEQLAYLSQQVNNGNAFEGKYIRLTQDILLNDVNADGSLASNREFTRIGTGASRSFKGNFDGASFRVIGLYINKSNDNYQGLFGYADTGSAICNLTISGTLNAGDYSGSVAGYTNGLIENCTSGSTVTATWKNYHGGIAGYAGAASVIRNCTVSGDVLATNYSGGIVAYTAGTVEGCATTATCDVSVTWGSFRGGIAAYADSTSVIRNCSAAGTVTGADSIGGIAGYSSGAIESCENVTARVSGNTKAGGIVGYAAGSGSIVSDCGFQGTLAATGGNYFGGIAGLADGTVTDCVVSGVTISGSSNYFGGIVGYASGSASKVADCTVASTTVTESSGGGYAGGVTGKNDGEISNCAVDVTVSAPNSYIGGVSGYSSGPSSVISGCTVAGRITATAGEGYVGGVAGRTDGLITECEVTAPVTGQHHYIGGVVGFASTGSEVTKSSSSGNVSGNELVGGIAGKTDGVISICVNTGDVTGRNGHIGGIAGESGANCELSNCFNSGAIEGAGQGGIGGIIGYVDQSTVIHHNLNKGEIAGSQYVGCITGNPLNDEYAWNNYYYDYESSPTGTSTGDIATGDDGAVPVGDLTWEEICELLNTDEDETQDVWSQDLDDDGVPKPQYGDQPAEPSTARIKAGKFYTPVELGTETSAAVTADSVFTVAFAMHYGSALDLAAQTVGLSAGGNAVVLPAGTSITMCLSGSYYYLNIIADTDRRIQLGEFIKMNSLTEHYPSAQSASGEQREYLFIFDFAGTENGLAAAAAAVKLLNPDGSDPGASATVTVGGKNAYTVSASGGTNAFTAGFSRVQAAGYDFKTDGRVFAYEISLKKGGVPVPFPIGTRVNGATLSSELPFLFSDAPPDSVTFSIDIEDSASPLSAGSYTAVIKAYSAGGVSEPRGGYLLAAGEASFTITEPPEYGVRAECGQRVFTSSSAAIPVSFDIEALGAADVKWTLQYKYGKAYVNVEGMENLPVALTDGSALLEVPAGSVRGTYRFLFAQYDGEGELKARTVKNVILR